MATEMVMAYGENGLEPTPKSKTVSIRAIPLGPNNEAIPATVRFMAGLREGGGIPIRLLRVVKPSKWNGNSHLLVRFQCTPFVRYESDAGPVYGHLSACSVRNEDDANDRIFDRLPPAMRARILAAVRDLADRDAGGNQ